MPAWVENSSNSIDCLDTILPSDEAILEAMCARDNICEDLHHRSYFLPELSNIENQEFHVRLSDDVDTPVNPLPREGVFSKGIWQTFPLLYRSTSPGSLTWNSWFSILLRFGRK